MTDPATDGAAEVQARRRALMEKGLARRKAADRRFRWFGFGAVGVSVLMLVFLLVSMGSAGFAGFQRSEVRLSIPLAGAMQIDAERLTQPDPVGGLELAGLPRVVENAAIAAFGPDGADMLANGAWREVAATLVENPALLGSTVEVSLPASDDLAKAQRGEGDPAAQQVASAMVAKGTLVRAFDDGFLSRSDATSPQTVGIWGALKGSM